MNSNAGQITTNYVSTNGLNLNGYNNFSLIDFGYAVAALDSSGCYTLTTNKAFGSSNTYFMYSLNGSGTDGSSNGYVGSIRVLSQSDNSVNPGWFFVKCYNSNTANMGGTVTFVWLRLSHN
jgi:hypothetical protein